MDYNSESPLSEEHINSTDDAAKRDNIQQNNGFVFLSLIMGIIAFLSSAFIPGALVAGALSILFAILSKGKDTRMQFLPKIGIVASVAGILLSIIITAAVAFLIFSNENIRNEFVAIYNEMYEEMYGNPDTD